MRSVDSTLPDLRSAHIEDSVRALVRVFNQQRAQALSTRTLDRDVWDPQLRAVVLDRNSQTATDFALRVATEFEGEYDPAVMGEWLQANAEVTAEGINQRTAERLGRAANSDQPLLVIGDLFTTLATVTAGVYATQMVTTAANFGAQDAARKTGARTKTWRTNSGDPRSAHANLNGETVPLDEPFSNGMLWPGDPSGGGENNANCMCSIVFGRGD